MQHDKTLPPEAYLAVKNVGFHYGQTAVLRNVSLSVAPGEVCGLLGPNGSGKTTLFKCCMRFLPVHTGIVHCMGQDVARMKTSTLAKQIAYVPQEHRQPFPFLVLDMVLMGRTPHMSRLFKLNHADKRFAMEALERVGMSHAATTPCNQLSGGQRQLVLIARALAQQTPVILLDEPTSALDFSNQLTVWNILRSIAADGKAVMVCCHDPNHILWFCHRMVLLNKGQVLAKGDPRTVLTTSVLQTLYGPCCSRITLANDESIMPTTSADSDLVTAGMICPTQTNTMSYEATKNTQLSRVPE